jgi:putative peptide zinc metalloprotease protein
VEEVQAAALTSDTGSTVTITARMDNRDGLLTSGMTGYAKIRCETTSVIVAFTKALVLFVRVEIWSWLP